MCDKHLKFDQVTQGQVWPVVSSEGVNRSFQYFSWKIPGPNLLLDQPIGQYPRKGDDIMSRFTYILGLLALSLGLVSIGCSDPYELLNQTNVDLDDDANDDDDATDDDDTADDDDASDDDTADDDDDTADDDDASGDPSDYTQLCFQADEQFDGDHAEVMISYSGWNYLDDEFPEDDVVCADWDFVIGDEVKVNSKYEVDGEDNWGVENAGNGGVVLTGTFFLRTDSDEEYIFDPVDQDDFDEEEDDSYFLDYTNGDQGGGDLKIVVPDNP